MTSLRTIWGTDLSKIPPLYQLYFLGKMEDYLKEGKVSRSADVFRLTDAGKLLADRIAMELFVE
jgi:coproporphyrinogen III oxidase-like Fe-S oxidoreductase